VPAWSDLGACEEFEISGIYCEERESVGEQTRK